MKILLFIRSLELGGAEHQLLNLAAGLSKNHEVLVLTFYDRNEYKMLSNNYQLLSLNKKGRWDIVRFSVQFFKVIKRVKPDVIYSFMGDASLVTLLARLSSKRVNIVWGLRSSNMKFAVYGRLQVLLRYLECKLSILSDLVIANSEAGKREAIFGGFKSKNIIVIPNGVDNIKFKKCDVSRWEIRKMLSLPDDAVVIGTVARHDPMKGLEVFLDAAEIYIKTAFKTYFLIIGSGPETYSEKLKNKARSLGLQDCIIWVSKTNKVAHYYNAMDIFTSTSTYGEGFSNVVCEAMLSQLSCVVTNVGDTKTIVGDYGLVVPPDSPVAVANAWGAILTLSDREIQKLRFQSRKRILTCYSVDSMVTLTESALTSVVYNQRNKRAS